MKTTQQLSVDGITVTLAFEAPLEAVRTLAEDAHAPVTLCNSRQDVRLTALPEVAQVMSAALPSLLQSIQSDLLATAYELETGTRLSASPASEKPDQKDQPAAAEPS